MSKRGKVLRDPHAGPGLLMVEGQQYPFALEGVWKSEAPPKPGQVVDVDLDAQGAVHAITVVPESHLAKEQADKALAVAREKGGAVLGAVVAKIGIPTLVAEGLLFIGWIFLDSVSIQLPFAGKLGFTFWQVLGFLNSSNLLEIIGGNGHPSAGFYGFLALVALAGPLVHYFWKDKLGHLCGTLPFLFMAIIGLIVRSNISSAFGGGADAGSMGAQMQDQAMQGVSLGLGAYLSVLVSLYFAGIGIKDFLAAKASTAVYEKSKEAA